MNLKLSKVSRKSQQMRTFRGNRENTIKALPRTKSSVEECAVLTSLSQALHFPKYSSSVALCWGWEERKFHNALKAKMQQQQCCQKVLKVAAAGRCSSHNAVRKSLWSDTILCSLRNAWSAPTYSLSTLCQFTWTTSVLPSRLHCGCWTCLA